MTIKINGKTVMLVVGLVGVVVTAVFSAKNAPKAQKRKEEALEEKRENTGDPNAQLTTVESIKAQVPAFAPAIVSGAFTLGSLLGSDILSEKNLQKARKAFGDYKDMTEKLEGKGAVKTIEKAVEQKKLDEKAGKSWEQEETFRITFQGHSIEFKGKRSDVIMAFYEANRKFMGYGRISFNEFLETLGQKPMDEGDDRGWDQYTGEVVYGYTWIDFALKDLYDEPGITEIYFPFYPHYMDEEDAEQEVENYLEATKTKCINA